MPLQLTFNHLGRAGYLISTLALVFQEFYEVRDFSTRDSDAKVNQGLHWLRLPSVEVALDQWFALVLTRCFKFLVASFFIVLFDGFRNVV